MTKYDKIQSMTVEELRDFIADIINIDYPLCPGYDANYGQTDQSEPCKIAVQKWLESEEY